MNLTHPVMIIKDSFDSINPMIEQAVITVLILLIGLILGKVLGRLLCVLLREVRLNKLLKSGLKLSLNLEAFLVFILSYGVYAFALLLALDRLKLTNYILYALIAIVLVVFVMSIVGSVKDFLPNFVSGLRLRKAGRIKKGYFITLPDLKGTVVGFTLLETEIRTPGNDLVVLPNSIFVKKQYRVRKTKK